MSFKQIRRQRNHNPKAVVIRRYWWGGRCKTILSRHRTIQRQIRSGEYVRVKPPIRSKPKPAYPYLENRIGGVTNAKTIGRKGQTKPRYNRAATKQDFLRELE